MTLIDYTDKNKTPQETKAPTETQKSPTNKDDLSQWGYDLYPRRRAPKEDNSYSKYLKSDKMDQIKCERNVYQCIKQSPLIKIIMGALKSAGCTVDIRRHIACEECDYAVSGGYDPILNQVIICQNNVKKSLVQAVLTHEMIHMFDYCTNNLDFKNLDHLACTEIRAANLAHCSFLSAWTNGDASPFNIKEAHQNCVKSKALASIVTARSNVTKEQAREAVNRVFPKCYADLEPIGRRLRRNSDDMYRAYEESQYYGYGYP